MNAFTQKWGKKIGVAVVVMFAAKGVGFMLGKSMAESAHASTPTVSANAPKTMEEAFAIGQQTMEAALGSPASEFCKGQAQHAYSELSQTMTFPDPAAFTDYLAKSCTGGSDIARKMHTEWGFTAAQINKESADLSTSIPNIATKFEGQGIPHEFATPMAQKFVELVQAGYEIEALKAH